MKFTWKGKWKAGEVSVETQSARELLEALKELETLAETKEGENRDIPKIPSMLGCTDAVRLLMEDAWAKQPKAMSEIREALEANELFFSKESLAATLVTMTRKGDVRRLKETGKWKYFAK